MVVTPSLAPQSTQLIRPINLRKMTHTSCRRRKSSAARTELISASVNEITSAPLPDSVTDSRKSACFSESRDDGQHTPHPNDNVTSDSCRVEYLNEVSDDSGTSWHALEKTHSQSSRHNTASQSPRSALANFGYAESAVGISKKVSLEIMNRIASIYLTSQDP